MNIKPVSRLQKLKYFARSGVTNTVFTTLRGCVKTANHPLKPHKNITEKTVKVLVSSSRPVVYWAS